MLNEGSKSEQEPFEMAATKIIEAIQHAQRNRTHFCTRVDAATFDIISRRRIISEDSHFEYDQETEVLGINKPHNAISAAIRGFFIMQASIAINTAIPSGEFSDYVLITPSARVNSFTGSAHVRTIKEPDAAISPKHCTDNNYLPYVLLETGFSTEAAEIMQDKKLWIDNTGDAVRAVVVVMVTEGPRETLVLDEDGEFLEVPEKAFEYTHAMWADSYILKAREHKGYIALGELTVRVQIWRPCSGIPGGRKDFEVVFDRKSRDKELFIPLTGKDMGIASEKLEINIPLKRLWKQLENAARMEAGFRVREAIKGASE